MVMAVDGKVEATPQDDPGAVIAFARDQAIKFVDFRFSDLLGQWQHFSVPTSELTERLFAEGIGFDGSSIKGFQHIHESDMLLFPDPRTAFVDPVLEVPTLSLICDIVDPVTKGRYSRDPRYVATKAEAHLRESGIADTSYWGPELEFYIFNSLRFGQSVNEGFYHIDSAEGIWNSGQNGTPNLGFRPRLKEGYFPTPPVDQLQDVRSRIALALADAGIEVEVHHHEVGTAGQTEIDMRYDSMVSMADKVLVFKYIVKNVCHREGLVANFMPKPLFGDNGSGMHTHQSLWKEGTPLFYDKDGYALLSDLARWYIGGLLAHAPAVLAFAAPTTNSYRRLVPGYEAPVKLAYSARNRSACIRIPTYSERPQLRRLEFRSPDPACNPYLAFSAMLMAGLDGIRNQIEPPSPIEADLYELEGARAEVVKNLPGSLEEVLLALEQDHDFLYQGGVFTEDLVDTWVALKREREVDPVRLRPHPYEFMLYADV
ncbi:MAG TPA: type I glutamate--ammonia ligase [Candidatus Dormibacteraeota bacterium]|nr:type I glutamate--ammonia ligase [Candidatus Dormibacteraeota bacterium]